MPTKKQRARCIKCQRRLITDKMYKVGDSRYAYFYCVICYVQKDCTKKARPPLTLEKG